MKHKVEKPGGMLKFLKGNAVCKLVQIGADYYARKTLKSLKQGLRFDAKPLAGNSKSLLLVEPTLQRMKWRRGKE